MLDVLIIIYMLIFDVITIVNIYMLVYMFKKLNKDENKETTPTNKKRVHTSIKTSDYNSSYGNRGYDIYKNKDGLYEPQKPHNGIELKNKEE